MKLKTLNIQQSPNVIERIDHTILSQIYDAYEAILANNNGRNSTLRGQLSVDRAYDYWVSDLTRKWTNLRISVDNGGVYHSWADKEFNRCISKIWGDGYGVIESQFNISKTTQKQSSVESPFYGNKNVRVIDLRPFNNLLFEGTGNYNWFFTVPKEGTGNEYQLREIYVSNVKANTPFQADAFIGTENPTTYTLDKLWWEGPDRVDDGTYELWASTTGNSWYERRVVANHFYYLNHSTGYGRSHHKSITIGDETFEYIDMGERGWQGRGFGALHMLMDTPIPIKVGYYGYWGQAWSQTTFYVPDDQLSTWQKLYSSNDFQSDVNNRPKDIKSISDYNILFRNDGLENWWVYPGKQSNFRTT